MMTDKRESTAPVRVELKLEDWWYVPNRTHTKIIEIDREDWNALEPYERKELVEEHQSAWLEEHFGLSYEVLDADDFNDVTSD